ncbi:uncharacterized protein SPAPADRAFT_52351 [Spathaspora passalidarum NRRL Y-27907]|uniref:Uncharacterized protein n=1 Tax=Spathaspora passalidarum (strain NRRL Y-27907 / 11-Y1) TaxID=619300 RepID=G3AUG1_SPAPN|nr:uncharacterized protein SPAPADRAFT_52348 [Spathaspora passalidarum NRRL Y-27907]XP_007377218.1 uncharacterized protein SPAPADRAFT_52351 [Spathaspora passalidarum NRRL Y-27907]EGW30247.1 hypothetical protein SPAPADRAFT_52351 [Spathaspora passalidarum NRRL Y-27907]EGW31180.1 hypothetical protein SPAPADRAFT_52348 [Spathaspora passalidarum NRRL Y-27907]
MTTLTPISQMPHAPNGMPVVQTYYSDIYWVLGLTRVPNTGEYSERVKAFCVDFTSNPQAVDPEGTTVFNNIEFSPDQVFEVIFFATDFDEIITSYQNSFKVMVNYDQVKDAITKPGTVSIMNWFLIINSRLLHRGFDDHFEFFAKKYKVATIKSARPLIDKIIKFLPHNYIQNNSHYAEYVFPENILVKFGLTSAVSSSNRVAITLPDSSNPATPVRSNQSSTVDSTKLSTPDLAALQSVAHEIGMSSANILKSRSSQSPDSSNISFSSVPASSPLRISKKPCDKKKFSAIKNIKLTNSSNGLNQYIIITKSNPVD